MRSKKRIIIISMVIIIVCVTVPGTVTHGKIDCSETMEYGEVEIREEGDKVLIYVTGTDDEGYFTAAAAFALEEFMGGDGKWLEDAIGSILFYSKVYDNDN